MFTNVNPRVICLTILIKFCLNQQLRSSAWATSIDLMGRRRGADRGTGGLLSVLPCPARSADPTV